MNMVIKCYCRSYQLAFRLAMPLLPYREPERLDSIQALPPLLERLKLRTVLLVTDRPLREAGATRPLEELLEQSGVHCAVYDGTRANPTVRNVEEAREANPLYPVPKLMGGLELEVFYKKAADWS